MDKEGLGEDFIDIWTKSIIQKYEERQKELDTIRLANFVTPAVNGRQKYT